LEKTPANNGTAREPREDGTQSLQYKLDLSLGNVLNQMVRGGDHSVDLKDFPEVGSGQIWNVCFVQIAQIAEEVYGNDAPVLAIF